MKDWLMLCGMALLAVLVAVSADTTNKQVAAVAESVASLQTAVGETEMELVARIQQLKYNVDHIHNVELIELHGIMVQKLNEQDQHQQEPRSAPNNYRQNRGPEVQVLKTVD